MTSKRSLYRTLCDESARNARQFFADARRLKRVGSRGHAASLAVLSIEESSKALIYHEAAEGLLRVVRKHPNHVTTFTERELLDHKFKHALLANVLVDWLRYAPFYQAMEGLGKPRFTRDEVREILVGAVHAHRILQVDLTSGGRVTKQIQSIFALLENLNDLKNRGFYVDHSSGRIQLPDDLSVLELGRLLGLADGALDMVGALPHRTYTEHEKELQKRLNQELLKRIRRARRKAATTSAHP